MKYVLDNISSERLLFRKISPEDFDLWLPFYEDKNTSKYWLGIPKNPIKACRDDFDRTFFRYQNNLGGKVALIHKETKELVGLCGLLVQEINQKQEIEIAYSLLPKFWGFGYATEAAQQCKQYASANNLATSLVSIISVANLPSQKVALNNGMQIDFETTYANNSVYIFRVKL
jgi:RimJ/RimL family protein N-acetyltransferase